MKKFKSRALILLVHGIRDRARWQSEIQSTLENAGFIVELTNYDRMNLIEFLLPIDFFRNRAIQKVWVQMQHAAMLHPNSEISIIAHSFGTYIVARILQKQFNIKLKNVIFCGCVVKFDFPFEQINGRFASPILNEVGTSDPYPALAESITRGYGSAGTYGFRRPGVKDRFHNGAGHGFFLNDNFCLKYWVPFLTSNKFVNGDSPIQNPQLWVRLISTLKIKYFFFSFIALSTVIVIYAILRWFGIVDDGDQSPIVHPIAEQCYRFDPQSGKQSSSLGVRQCFPGKIVYLKYWDPSNYAGASKKSDPTSPITSWPIDRPNRVFQVTGTTTDGHIRWIEQNLIETNNKLERWADSHYWVSVVEDIGIGKGMTGFVLRRIDLQAIPVGKGKTQCDGVDSKRDVFEFAIPEDVIYRLSAGTPPTLGFRKIRINCAQEIGSNPLTSSEEFLDTKMPVVSAASD